MTEYRDRATGAIKSQGQLRKENPNVSLPKIWGINVCNTLNVDPILPSPKPTENVGPYQAVVRNGIEKDSNNAWVQAWKIVELFEEYIDEEGVTRTKAEQEAAYQQEIDNNEAAKNRSLRDSKLAETDWWASSDLTITDEQAAYRQALRDITNHENWPYLQEEDWPTKP